MDSLNVEQCKEYVRNIKDLEVSCFQQERLLQTLRNQIPNTEHRIFELEQRLKKEVKPKDPATLKEEQPHGVSSVIVSFIVSLPGAFFGAIAGIVLKIVVAIFSSKVGLFSSPWLPYIIWGAVIGFGLLLVVAWMAGRDDREKLTAKINAYPRELEAYNKRQAEIKSLIESKRNNVAIDIPREIRRCEENYNQTKALLKKYYDMDFIYPDFRGLVPMCTIYEYLESGRCFTLIGPHGAYNLYKQELWLRKFDEKLDVVIYKLDDIIDEINDTKRLLVREIRACNIQLSNIAGTLENIENNTALTQYYSSVTASNTTFMSWLAAFSYDKQNKMNAQF